ncbi:MAG: DUF3365 domain-containing protein [Rhizobiales bacterium]|nr:DUF3365 domain-containing protein [Hyphomicrobiales bacterium]
MKRQTVRVAAAALLASGVTAATAVHAQWFGSKESKGIPLQQVADMLHAVMESDRTVYTQRVVNRLQNEEKVIQADEHFMDKKALPLPAQMFRFGAEKVAEKTKSFSYSLLSLWPVNKQNAPRTAVEKDGLKFVADNKGKNYYGEETLGGKKYYTAVYADVAVSPACVSCHNAHAETPRTDFKLDDVMGGVVIRLPMN